MARLSFFTLLLTAVVAHLSLTAVPSAHALQGMNPNPPPMVRRAEHVNLNLRMIKKKRAADDPPINAIGDPSPTSDSAVVPSAPTTPTPSTPPTSTPQAAPSTRPTTTTPNVPTNTAIPTTTTGTTSTTSTIASSSSTTPTTTSTSTTPTSTPTTQATTRPITQSTAFVTQTAAASASTDASQDQSASFLPHSVIIGLIVTGSCIAAGAAIWTIIRKWKFSPSRHFEDRLEPINWEPTQASGLPHDPTVAALERASSRNGGSRNGGSRASLGSDDEHGQRNMTSVNHNQISMTPDFPPPHDFTAGNGAYGQGAGYVDMHRGPSPAPSAYGGHYETPNPYGAYDYNSQAAAYGQRGY